MLKARKKEAARSSRGRTSPAKVKTWRLPSDLSHVRKASEDVLRFFKPLGLSEGALFDVRLCFEEALINAMKHGNGLKKGVPVDLEAGYDDRRLWLKLEDRGTLFVEPTDDVYEGRIVGEHLRPEDLDVNIVREKHLTNHRSSTGDELVRMNRARKLSLDEALEFIREDECVEVTPDAIRLRKSVLHAGARQSARAKEKSRNANA